MSSNYYIIDGVQFDNYVSVETAIACRMAEREQYQQKVCCLTFW